MNCIHLRCEMYYLNHFDTYEELVAPVEQFVRYYIKPKAASVQAELPATGNPPKLD